VQTESIRLQAETRTITVSGQRLRVAIRPGNGTRTPLLLMNGFGVNLEVLKWFVKALDPAIEVICFDVLGVSWGGALAQQFAFQYSSRCRRLILVSTGTGALMVPGRPWALAQMATPRRYLDPAHMEENAAALYGGKVRTHPELAHEFARTVRSGGLQGYFFQMLGGLGWTSVPWLPLLRQPTLILHGDDDPGAALGYGGEFDQPL
jgi:pimeloyl-ACP methyl ester carboxylesterase